MPYTIINKFNDNISLDAKINFLLNDETNKITIGDLQNETVEIKVKFKKNQDKNDYKLLTKTYLEVLNLAKDNNFKIILLPLLYKEFNNKVIKFIINNVIKVFLEKNDIFIYLLPNKQNITFTSKYYLEKINDYIDEFIQIDETYDIIDEKVEFNLIRRNVFASYDIKKEPIYYEATFTETLISLIEERDEKPSAIYNRANITKQLFSKIRNKRFYHPSKQIAIALGIALRLDLDEMNYLLEKAGYILSKSIKFDIIIRFCIMKKNYDIMDINEILYDFNEHLLGSTME